MRILQTCTRFVPGGIQRHVIDLAGWLRERGHDVTLGGTPGPWSDLADPNFVPIDVHNVAAEGGPLPRRLVYLARAAAALRPELKRRRIELIHAHESAPGLVVGLAAIGTGIPVVLSFHGSNPERIREFGRIGRMVATRLITPSHRSAEDLATIGGVPRDRLHVIGLGIKPVAAPAPEAVAEIRRELLGPDGRILVLTVARLAHQKGIDYLVEIVRRVTAADPAIRFAVVGDGPQRDEARGWAEAAGVADRLQFLGHSNDPASYMAAADLFLLPSRWESLPITIVEAFRQRLPVIATDCGGVCELVDDSVGRLAQIGDVEALAGLVLALAHDDALRESLSETAAARSGEPRFEPEHIHSLFERFYGEVLAARKAGR